MSRIVIPKKCMCHKHVGRVDTSAAFGLQKRQMRQRSEVLSASTYAETGRLIRDSRKAKGISQGRLAASVGLSRTSITNIERGRQKLLLHTLVDIARVLGVEPYSLLPKGGGMSSSIESQLPNDVSPSLRKLISRMVQKDSPAS
jgi:DNA-binding XRE family transcriptional regulator